MDAATRKHFDNLGLKDPEVRYQSFQRILAATGEPVDWAGEAWDELLELARHGDNHQRAIAAQLMSSLAKSDPTRMLKELDKLFAVTRDERFVTARHSLQSLWKVAVAGPGLRRAVIDRLSNRFRRCATEKNCTLVRYDIIQVFRRVYDQVSSPIVMKKALALIETESDGTYRRKYLSLWKDA